MTLPRGVRLLVILLLALWAWRVAKLLLPVDFQLQPAPAPPSFFVFLGDGFPKPGVHQFSDGITPLSVIHLTLKGVSLDIDPAPLLTFPLTSGEALDVVLRGSQIVEIKRYWMPAEMRMTLYIPLHPDRMSAGDWEALPGIGRELARRIEEDRQKNGDFGSLKALRRVKGVGVKLIERLEPYF